MRPGPSKRAFRVTTVSATVDSEISLSSLLPFGGRLPGGLTIKKQTKSHPRWSPTKEVSGQGSISSFYLSHQAHSQQYVRE